MKYNRPIVVFPCAPLCRIPRQSGVDRQTLDATKTAVALITLGAVR